ncbi:MAG: amidohydrolase family protein [Planctomycetota bacterium]
MRIPRSPSLLGASLCALGLLLAAPAVRAQEPPPAPAPTPAPTEQRPAGQPAGQPGEQPAADPGAADAPRRQRRPGRLPPGFAPLVLEAGHVHPVTGPAIENGVVVVRGERIVAVGKKGEVEVPQGAIVRSFPNGHVYPGLIDAATDAYTDGSLRSEGGADGGTSFADDLRKQEARFHDLAAQGITTAYVTVRSPAFVRGQGAIVRPRKDGAFEPWRGKESAALQMRLASATLMSHALERQQQFQQADGLFEGLDEYRKSFTDHADALKKYDKEFADYLAFHQKKKDGDKKPEADKPADAGKPAGAAAPAAGDAPAGPGPGPGGRPGGRRGGPGGQGGGGQGGGGSEPPKGNEPPKNEPPKNEPPKKDPPKQLEGAAAAAFEAALATLLDTIAQDPKPQDPPKPEGPKPDGQQPAPAGGAPAGEKKDEGPKRPTYPKPPQKDPQRDALLKVLDGELALRVEAHRPDELRAALALQQRRSIPLLVLEQAYGAGALADDLAKAGVSVVVTECLPLTMAPPYDRFDVPALPAKLAAAGVPFAIATGRASWSSLLPLQAAAAVAGGLAPAEALRAITLTPAEILGVAKDTGSLQPGKYADVLVTDRPLFQTDSRVLLVLGKGNAEYEVK